MGHNRSSLGCLAIEVGSGLEVKGLSTIFVGFVASKPKSILANLLDFLFALPPSNEVIRFVLPQQMANNISKESNMYSL